MPVFGGSYNPANVMLRRSPIEIGGTTPTPNKPYLAAHNVQKRPPMNRLEGFLPSQAVRATGQGPYDPAYRQDLATYAGGLFQRPGGFLGINPTGNISGNPTGTGSAPVPGAPTDLLSAALGGQSFTAPGGQPAAKKPTTQKPRQQNFLDRYFGAGRYLRNY